MPLQPSSIYTCPLQMSQSAFFPLNLLCSYILIGNRLRVKSLGMAQGLAKARPPGSAKFANTPPTGLTRRQMPRSSQAGRAGRKWN